MWMVRRSAALRAAALCISALLAAAPVAGAEEEQACGDSVTVERGDTLHRIAERCGTSVPELISANPELSNPDLIEVGQTLTIPADDRPAAADAGQPTETGEPGEAEAGEPTESALSSMIEGLGPIGQAEAEASPGLDPSSIPIGRIIDEPGSSGRMER
jgi:LysM repeat protein